MTIHFSAVPATFRNCPRTGSTSFKFWILKNVPSAEVVIDPINNNGSLQRLSLAEIDAKWGTAGTTFAFVRNPYARLVSAFHFIGQRAIARINNRKTNAEGHYPYNVETDIKLMFKYQKGFRDWVTDLPNIVQQPLDYTNMALFNTPATQNQIDCFNGCVPDLIVKLENISTDFVKIQNLINCHKPFIHENKTDHSGYRNYYDTDTQKIVHKWIERDLETFGYTF
jgi:hypothetical protein